MKKIIVIVALIGGFFHLKNNGYLPSGFSSYGVDGNAALKILTFERCGAACTDAIDELDDRDVAFSHHIVDPNDKSSENYALWQDLGGGSFPILVAGEGQIDGYHSPQLAGFLAHRLGAEALYPNEQYLLDEHFYADGEPMVVMYGASWCGYCKKLRKELDSAGIDFMEIDVEKSNEKSLIVETLNVSGYPTMYVGYERVGGRLNEIKMALRAY